MHKKIILKFGIALLFCSLAFVFVFKQSAHSWGFFAHKQINHIAVFTLPSPLIGFYKKHIDFVTEHAVDPDKRRYAVEGEAVRHYIDLDNYYDSNRSVKDIPMFWDSAVAKYSEDTLQTHGILPWSLLVTYNQLVCAFESKDVDKILKYSADIGHYIGDATVPLHTTKNYNGQLTNQKGIHGFWESRIPELFSTEYDFFTGKAVLIEKPLKHFWTLVYDSHALVDSVLLIEKRLSQSYPKDMQQTVTTRGQQNMKTYSESYSRAYSDAMDNMVEARMRTAIISVGSIWYSAWIKAGSPNVEGLMNTSVSDGFFQELEALETLIKTKHIESREHEH